MQIDFHHATTYALARMAGFSHDEARVVAHASQYVDDAVEAGSVEFSNGAMYARTSSAHKMLDYRNFEALADHLVWVPFHFLPGNGGLEAGQDPDGSFIQKLVCRPDSPVAREMLGATIADRAAPYGLHRLGIAMHVYADTWAHQGFAGKSHAINDATDVTGEDGKPDRGLLAKLQGFFISSALPLGHGTVLGNPDKPYLVWAYTNGLGERIARNNPRDYMTASLRMIEAMARFRASDPGAPVAPPAERDVAMLGDIFLNLREPNDDARHARWLELLAKGAFSFGPVELAYVAQGEGSWKHAALGAKNDDGLFDYTTAFLASDWKLFHDALQAHRFDVINRILPRYGICAA